MASNGARFAWGFTRFFVGLLLWCVAALFVFVLVDGAMPLWAAITVTALVVLGLPSLLTRLLLPAFRRLGENARWWELWPGLCGVVALLAIVGPLLFGRAFSGRKLQGVGARHPGAAPWIKRTTTAIGRWLATPPSGAGGAQTGLGDGGVRGDASADSHAESGAVSASTDSASEDASGSPAETDAESDVSGDALDDNVANDGSMSDATDDVTDDARPVDDEDGGASDDPEDASAAQPTDSGVAPAVVIDPSAAGSGVEEFARLQPCSAMDSVWMGELALGGTDEIVLTCSDGLRVFYLQNDGIVERAMFSPSAPSGQQLFVQRALVADLDGDGRRDLGICAYFTSERGGSRGGNVWWARGRANGQFEAPRVLVAGGVDCAGMEFGDVNGDNRPDLVVVKHNNGYAATNRDSELLWYTGQGTQWTQRGRVRLTRGGWGVYLEDVTRDGILDAIVHTGWDGERRNWVIAGARRGPSGVVTVEDVGNERRTFVQAQGRLDGDTTTDVARIERGSLVLWRSTDDGRPVRTSVTRALDFEEYRF